ncbi:MAG: protein adenylyltransferase Fic [Vampirovibrionales bacterium]
MVLENKLNLTSASALAHAEEKLSKQQAKHLFESGRLDSLPVGTFASLATIHQALFGEVYAFAGQVRTVNIAKGNFRFASCLYLQAVLKAVDTLPHTTFDEIIEKYVELNIAHPFREGNGRAMRLWLDALLKAQLKQVIDWSCIDKEAYLSAMERSVVNPLELKTLLGQALTRDIDNRTVFMKGLDASYHYEGYTQFLTEEL